MTANTTSTHDSIVLRFGYQIEKITSKRDGVRLKGEINWREENYVAAAKCAQEAAVWDDVLFLVNKASNRYNVQSGLEKGAVADVERGVEAVDAFILHRLGGNANYDVGGQEEVIYREATRKFLSVMNLIIR